MKLFKSILQGMFMILLLVGVFGIYTQLKILNERYSNVKGQGVKAMNVSQGIFPATIDPIPTVAWSKRDGIKYELQGQRAVPVVIITDNEYYFEHSGN